MPIDIEKMIERAGQMIVENTRAKSTSPSLARSYDNKGWCVTFSVIVPDEEAMKGDDEYGKDETNVREG